MKWAHGPLERAQVIDSRNVTSLSRLTRSNDRETNMLCKILLAVKAPCGIISHNVSNSFAENNFYSSHVIMKNVLLRIAEYFIPKIHIRFQAYF